MSAHMTRGRFAVRVRRRKRPEQEAGAQLVRWMDLLRLHDGTRPGQYFVHVPNGGARTGIEAKILKGQGVRAGYPDYLLDLPRGRYHGLRLELKAKDGEQPTDLQGEWLERLSDAGYYACVAYGFDEARAHIEQYLALPPHICELTP